MKHTSGPTDIPVGKPTPGPWFYGLDPHKRTARVLGTWKGQHPLVAICHCHDVQDPSGLEAAANAQLIAAAPALAEALRDVRDELRTLITPHPLALASIDKLTAALADAGLEV